MQEAGSQQAGLLQEGSQLVADLQRALQKWRLQRLLSGPFDRGGAVVSVQVRLMRRRLDMAARTYLERGALASPLLLHP